VTDNAQPSDAHVRAEVDDHLGIITIDRPAKMNALTLPMALNLRSIAEEMDDDPDVWAILLRSSGDRAFCAGGDMVELIPQVLEAGSDVMNPDPESRFFTEVYTPMVCAVQGACLGGGLELLLGTDLRIVSDKATFGLPEVQLGLISGGGSNVLLPQQIGWVRAMELILDGEPISAHRALEIGLVTEVVPHEQLQERALARARRLTGNAPLAIRAAKEVAARSRALAGNLALDHRMTSSILRTEDAAAGMAAARSRSLVTFRNA
jgi:enoyl-CoA hydratase